ncbi:hypothetical protein, partial [Bacillus pumilus]|uniref:hypothetical protein n=1 Tax=Bacillus pumilus TaxID=1408 RepID=UPI003F68AC23
IGGKVFGGGLKNGEVEVVGVKDVREGKMVGEVLEYECVEGKVDGEVCVDGRKLVVKGKRMVV